MPKLDKVVLRQTKREFSTALRAFVARLREYVSGEDGEWTIKGFIDIYRNVYTISADTKIISKILEIHLFPEILKFAALQNYSVVLAARQNWYPDLSFVSQHDERIKFAVDLKTTYRDPKYPGHVNGFTLGSHGAYFKDRTSKKNIQFPYGEYSGHFCLGIIYTRTAENAISETEISRVAELSQGDFPPEDISQNGVTAVERLRSITSVIKDFQFFVCEKWQLASDRQGSGNTANIGSITCIEDILQGNGTFARLGEKWFDQYWMNYGRAMTTKRGQPVKIKNLKDFVKFRRGDVRKIVPRPKRKRQN